MPSWRRIGGSGTPSCSNSTACATLITFGHQRHMSDLFGVSGRRLLKELDMPEPWRSHVDASLVLIDDLEGRIMQTARLTSAARCPSTARAIRAGG